ncbi:MAG: indolepyruvate ferredoxin oxidoreductase family protein, partial [Actinomycetia bacterium]|nr:indolepyruvate ferredoxin oxidoreductase family protein [Actinomycetes bacterium]
MTAAVSSGLDERYTAEAGTVPMTGVQALARLALDIRRRDLQAGLRTAAFVSGYEGSPLGGYDLELGRLQHLLDELGVRFEPGLNEELAATGVQGTQLAGTMDDKTVDGVVGLWYGKSPGLDRASDAIRHANLSGTHPAGGAVAFVGDDPTAKSSSVPGASEAVLADLGLPTLAPGSPQEVLDLGLHAAAMSRSCGLWTALKIVTNVADGSGAVDVDPARLAITMPDAVVEGEPYEHTVTAMMSGPTLVGLERSRVGVRLELARRYARANRLNVVKGAKRVDGANPRVGIIAAGKAYRDLAQALESVGIDEGEMAAHGIAVLKLAVMFPLDPEEIREFAQGLDEIIVVEEKRSFIEAAAKEILYSASERPVIVGKLDEDGSQLLSQTGELDPAQIATALRRRLGRRTELAAVLVEPEQPPRQRKLLPLAVRTPYFCSGCPHNTSTKVPDGALVGGGIGCHSLALLMPPSQVGSMTGLTQMGGEGAQWIGMAPFVERAHLFQNLGDGTFHHSGSLAVRAAVAADAHITFKLLYNSAVAMTGGQQAIGQRSVPEVAAMAAAEGVQQTIITTPTPKTYRRARLPSNTTVWHRDRVVEAQEKLAEVSGVTLLIHDQECATELRRKRKRGLADDPEARVVINERICEGCGDCGAVSNCLSVRPIDTEFGRKTRIDQSSCNVDYSCLAGDCPAFMKVRPRAGAVSRFGRSTLDGSESPAPPLRHRLEERSHTTRIVGIGGAGVVTLSQILGVAAMRAGLHVVSLDQTGLAQKGGAVVSDIKVSRSPETRANKAATGEVDLYLGADLVVASDPANLAVLGPEASAVVATGVVPTGQMVTDVNRPGPPEQALIDQVRAAVDPDNLVLTDVRDACNALFGTDQFANLVLAGAAYQRGALPVPVEAIEEAVRLNGQRSDDNVQAFRRGRQLVYDPEGFERDVAAARPAGGRRQPSPRTRAVVEVVGADKGSALA